MPKRKTSKTAAKRVKRTASGKYKFKRQGNRHLASSKSRKRKRRLRASGILAAPEQKRLKKILIG